MYNSPFHSLKFLLIVSLFVTTVCLSQNNESDDETKTVGFNYGGTTLETVAQFSQNDAVPFWFVNNRMGRFENQTNLLGRISNSITYNTTENSGFTLYSGVVASDGFNDNIRIDELALVFSNSWLHLEAGKKQPEFVFDGLGVTNKNFLWSTNAQAMPGLLIKNNKPIKIFNFLEIDELALGYYIMDDDRFVEDTRVHYKKIGTNFIINSKNSVSLDVQHFVQWAGTSPIFGELANDFEAFVDVFLATAPESNPIPGEEANALGNHLGSYFLEYTYAGNTTFSIYHEHPFEDGSSSGLSNFPDGLYGINITPTRNRYINKFVYEFITTNSQSKGVTSSGADNYFNNGLYRTGWIYKNRIIGLPLFIANFNQPLDENYRPIVANTITAHHLGVSGSISKVSWEAKFTYVKNKGLRNSPLDTAIENFYSYAKASYVIPDYGTISLFTGLDSGNFDNTNLGGGITYKYNF